MSKGLIFIIDDDQGIRDAVGELLEFEGFSVKSAANGEDGLAQLKAMDPVPDLIFLDLMMPILDGLQFRRLQLAEGVCPSVPVILMSAASRLEEKQAEALLAGHLRKPMEIQELIELAERHCSQ